MERVRVVPLTDVFGSPDARTIVIREGRAGSVVAGLAGLVLLAGCATLMAPVMVHYERRRRELSVRIALGASRRRLAAELAGELAWVAAGGAAGAVLVAVWSLRTLPALSLPGGVDLGRLDLSIDWRVLAAGLSTTVLTLVAAALVPVRRFTRANLAGELIAASSTTPASSQRLRQTLLALHVSATIVVLVAAGLFVRAVVYGFSAGPGFDVDRTVYVKVQVATPFMSSESDAVRNALMTGNTTTPRARAAFAARRGRRRDRAVADRPRSGELRAHAEDRRDARRAPGAARGRAVRQSGVAPGPRPTDPQGSRPDRGGCHDEANSGPVDGIADPDALAGRRALGQALSFGGPRQGTYTVVGIVPDFVYGSLTQASAGVVVRVSPRGFGMEPPFVVRTGRPDLLVEPIRTLVKDVVPDAPRLVVSTGREIVARDLGRQRLGAWFFSGFGLVALVLGAGGVFGLVAYLAESRRREFGVRLALGATPRDLVWRGVAAGLAPVSIGAAAGLLLSALVARIFVSWLPGLSALDPLTYASVALLMIGCAALAGLAAAWRLRRIAPGEALRAE